MVRFGVPGQNIDTLSYADGRLATVPSVQAPRRPTVNDKKFPLWCEWRVDKEATAPAVEGEFWKLIRYESNGDATWVQFGGGGGTGPLLSVETDDGTPNVLPDASGEIQIFGSGGISVTGQGPGRTVTVSLAGGGTAVEQVNVDFNTAPGTDPVVPTASGEIQIYGNTVTNATNASSPVASHSRAANQFHIDVQLAAAVAATPADPNDVGLCSFDDSQFSVDGNGFVQLIGGGLAIDQINVDANTAPGTDPVVPDGTGEITVSGAAVAAHSVPIETHSRAANAYNIEVQVASDITGAPGDTNDAGLASFDDVSFLVDADGYVESKSGIQQGTSNIGCSYDSGTGVFTIHGYDGTALSATNPGIIWMQSDDTAGYLKKFEVTANQSFIDDVGASEIIGNPFGTTTSAAWSPFLPFYIYAVQNSDPAGNGEPPIAFMLSRIPQRTSAPVVANIGAPDDPVADTDGSMWSFDNITETDYASQRALCIGSIRAVKSSSDDWTIQSISSIDGIGQFQENVLFAMADGQNGAVSSFLSSSNGGDTIPVFANVTAAYKIQRDGMCQYLWNFNNVSTSGVGTGTLRVHVPFGYRYSTSWFANSGYAHLNTTAGTYYTAQPYVNIASTAVKYIELIASGSGTALYTPATYTTSPQISNGALSIYYPMTQE